MKSEELDEYLALSYPYELIPDEAGGFVAHHPDVEGCIAQGETAEEAVHNLDMAREMWIQCRLEDGLPVPRPLDEEPGGWLAVRLPRFLHEQLMREARRQEVSLNQLVASVLAQHMGAVTGVESAASRPEGLVNELTERVQPIIVPITTFAPEPFELRDSLWVVVQPVADGFTATFFDANISTSGDTQQEAVANLKDLILDVFLDLEEEPKDRLGPEPARQLAVLRALIRKVS